MIKFTNYYVYWLISGRPVFCTHPSGKQPTQFIVQYDTETKEYFVTMENGENKYRVPVKFPPKDIEVKERAHNWNSYLRFYPAVYFSY